RVGELDEEMVYETRVGEAFVLGASTWRIVDITPSQVIVTPAPGEPGKIAFWKADAPSRPVELGAALGKMTRELRAMDRDAASKPRLRWRWKGACRKGWASTPAHCGLTTASPCTCPRSNRHPHLTS